MKAQITPYFCGPASVSNALRWLGHRVGQTGLAKYGTTEADGSHEGHVKMMILKSGRQFLEINTSDPVNAWWTLSDMSAPIVCCVNQWSHWVCVIGVSHGRVTYFDPAREEYLMKENHVVTVSRGKFMKRWQAARRTRGQEPGYYGLVVL